MAYRYSAPKLLTTKQEQGWFRIMSCPSEDRQIMILLKKRDRGRNRNRDEKENISRVANLWIIYYIIYLKLLNLCLSCVPYKPVPNRSCAVYGVPAPLLCEQYYILLGNFLQRIYTFFTLSISFCLWISLSIGSLNNFYPWPWRFMLCFFFLILMTLSSRKSFLSLCAHICLSYIPGESILHMRGVRAQEYSSVDKRSP